MAKRHEENFFKKDDCLIWHEHKVICSLYNALLRNGLLKADKNILYKGIAKICDCI